MRAGAVAVGGAVLLQTDAGDALRAAALSGVPSTFFRLGVGSLAGACGGEIEREERERYRETGGGGKR